MQRQGRGTMFMGVVTKLVDRVKPPPMVVWMLLSAVFFLAGAANSALHGAVLLAKVGVLGAIAAVVFLAAFWG